MILLKVQDCLSDNERERLHLCFANDVPLRIRDDPLLVDTLSLMHSLFGHDKINEEYVTVLIAALREIPCFDAVVFLENQSFKQLSNTSGQEHHDDPKNNS